MKRIGIPALALVALAGCAPGSSTCGMPSRTEALFPYTGAGEWTMGEGGDSARVCLYQRNATTVVGSVGGSKAVGLVHSDGTLVLALTRGGDVGVVQLTLDQGQPRAADVTWSGGGAQSVRIAKWRHPY